MDELNSEPNTLEEILADLKSEDISKRRYAVMLTEVTELTPEHKPEILEILYNYIEENRTSEQESIIVAVGSAIRKFGACMPESDLERYGELFYPKPNNTVNRACIDLELCKLYQWFKVLPAMGDYPRLTEALIDVCRAYLPLRILLQRNHGSCFIGGFLSLAVLDKKETRMFTAQLRGNRLKWLRELLAKRLEELLAARKKNGLTYDQLSLVLSALK